MNYQEEYERLSKVISKSDYDLNKNEIFNCILEFNDKISIHAHEILESILNKARRSLSPDDYEELMPVVRIYINSDFWEKLSDEYLIDKEQEENENEKDRH